MVLERLVKLVKKIGAGCFVVCRRCWKLMSLNHLPPQPWLSKTKLVDIRGSRTCELKNFLHTNYPWIDFSGYQRKCKLEYTKPIHKMAHLKLDLASLRMNGYEWINCFMTFLHAIEWIFRFLNNLPWILDLRRWLDQSSKLCRVKYNPETW